jgi:hypothetical protein
MTEKEISQEIEKTFFIILKKKSYWPPMNMKQETWGGVF